MNVGQLTAHLGLDLKGFQAGMAQVNKSMTQMGAKMQKVGKSMTMKLTAPMALIGGAAFKMSMDFESSMAKITGLVGVASEQVEAWKKQVMSLSSEVGVASTELAEALFFITSAGIKGAEAMEVLEMAGKASTAGLGETKVIADLVTSALNAYGTENLSAAEATDTLVAAVREGKIEADQLAGAMGSVLPLSSALGVSFDQVGAALAAMSRTGTNANVAATQLNAIMAAILKPTDQAEEALQKMGTSSKELRETMASENGLIKVLTQLKNIQNEYGTEMVAEVVPNIRALKGVMDLVGSNIEDNIKIFQSMEDSTGALDAAFESATDTAKFKFDKAMAQSKNALISIGDTVKEALVPVLETLGGMLQNLSDWFAGLSDTQKKFIAILAGIVAAAGPVLMVFGKFMTFLPAAIKGFKDFGSAIVGVSKKLITLVAANPILAIVAAVTALGIAIYKLWKNSKKTETTLQGLQKTQSQYFSSAMSGITALRGLGRTMDENTKGTQQYATAVNDYNKMAKEMNLLTIDGNSSLKERNKIMKANEQLILSRAATQAAAAQLEENFQKRFEILQRARSGETLSMEDAMFVINFGKIQGEIMAAKKRYEDFSEYVVTSNEKSSSSTEQLLSIINDQTKSIEERNAAIVKYNDLMKKTGGTELDLLSVDTPKDKPKITPPVTTTGGNAISEMQLMQEEMERIRQQMLADEEKYNKEMSLKGLSLVEQEKQKFQDKLKAIEDGMAAEMALYEGDVFAQAAIQTKWHNLSLEAEKNHQTAITDIIQQETEAKREALEQQLENIRQSLMTQEQLEAQAHQTRLEALRTSLSMGLLTWEEYNTLLEELNLAHAERMKQTNQTVADDMSKVQDTLVQGITDLSTSMFDAFSGGQDAIEGFADTMKQMAGRIIKELLNIAIASILSAEATKGLPGIILGAVGAGLIKALFSSQLQGMATGGMVTAGGAFMVGEKGPELVTLPAGAAVTPNHMLGQTNGGGELTTRISGRDLEIILNRASAQSKRR